MFNAIKYTQELEKAGFSREQAEAALNMVHQFGEQNLATKSDISDVRADMVDIKAELKADMADLKAELKNDMQKLEYSIRVLEYKMTIKMGAMLIGTIGVLATLQKLL